jgi:hypothetical protein
MYYITSAAEWGATEEQKVLCVTDVARLGIPVPFIGAGVPILVL